MHACENGTMIASKQFHLCVCSRVPRDSKEKEPDLITNSFSLHLECCTFEKLRLQFRCRHKNNESANFCHAYQKFVAYATVCFTSVTPFARPIGRIRCIVSCYCMRARAARKFNEYRIFTCQNT